LASALVSIGAASGCTSSHGDASPAPSSISSSSTSLPAALARDTDTDAAAQQPLGGLLAKSQRVQGARSAAAPPKGPWQMTPVALAGKDIFFDKSLSASKQMACATCHDPAHAYGPTDDRAIALGGPHGTSPGVRAVPSIRYKEFTPGYADLLDNPDGISVPAPGGGFAWDGRASSLAEQSKAPLMSPFEMANANPADVVAKLKASKSAESFVKAFGPNAFDDVDTAFTNVTRAIQAFQIEDPTFHPYTSKFDLHERGDAAGAYTHAEERGLRVFDDPKKGNCAGCHLDKPGFGDGSTGMFTDYSFEAIGVPRNAQIPANRDPHYYDLGICGPLRPDRPQPKNEKTSPFCGLFKTPTLRNAATRHAFFHNGVIHSLEQAVRFYNTRDTMPEIWYPTVGGQRKAEPDASFPLYGLVTVQYTGGGVQKYDDLPLPYRPNIDRQIPLDGRAPGSAPPMTEQEIADLVCFIETLTDDYRPGTSSGSGRCAE
jgi:cytochrome c peroxidase